MKEEKLCETKWLLVGFAKLNLNLRNWYKKLRRISVQNLTRGAGLPTSSEEDTPLIILFLLELGTVRDGLPGLLRER